MPSRDPLPAPVVPAPIPAPVPVPVPTPTPAPYAPPVQEPVSPYATPVQPLPPPVPAPSPQTAPVSPYAPPVAQPQSQPVYPPATVPAPTYPGTPEGYRVQVSVFEQPAFANAVARQLGGGATVESFERNGRTLYRVVVGPWPDHAAAERSRQAIIARGFGDALLIAD
nr:SPOR domain-containing protein [Brevundimonas sp. UBA5713]